MAKKRPGKPKLNGGQQIRQQKEYEVTCKVCKRHFTANKKTANLCDSRCRKRASRDPEGIGWVLFQPYQLRTPGDMQRWLASCAKK